MLPRALPLLTCSLLLTAPLAAQPLPERVAIGEGHMTVGFELKTTTHGDGPNGRTSAHSLMKYIVPHGNGWSEAEGAKVERWADMSIGERTAFFFESYKGGHDSTNFRVDTERFPFLDKSVSWYGSMNIPHIEVRSLPFDSPREALETMERMKADVRETIAFHMHVRFPDTTAAAQAEAMTEWLRRVSWAIWLRRADYSSKTDFVLKAMDNQPISVTELNEALATLSAEDPTAAKDIIERRGIRMHRLGNSDGTKSIDIEFRGLMRDTGRLKRYLALAGEAFGEGRTGASAFDGNSPFRNHSSNGVFKFRTFGWHGEGSWESGELNYLADQLEELRGRFGISSRVGEAELREAYKRLATADTENGKKMLLPSAFSWLFLPIEYDPGIPEAVQEQVEKTKAEYVRKLVRLAERVEGGEFSRPIEIATRARRILHDFVNETYTDGRKTAKLFEWYELGLFKPSELEERNERYRRETGRNRAAEWIANNPPSEGEGFGPRRRGASEALAFWDRAEVDRVFEAVRGSASERAAARALVEAELAPGIERARNATLEVEASGDVDARYDRTSNTVRVTTGLLNAVDARAGELPEAERGGFRRRALGLVLGHELSHAYGVKAERVADSEGLRVLERSGLGAASEVEARATLEAFSRSGELTTVERIRAWMRYGSEAARADALAAAARGEADPYARYRRADGTMDWKRVGRERAAREGLGLLNFGMALFLKELAVVTATGDRARIDEFFEGLLTTDFYKQYGLFVLGARAGEIAYTRYLQRFVKPRFVNGILKTNLVLATGLALPQIIGGTFEGKAFAISLGSLGLSSAAVKAGVSSIKWVVDLKKARSAGTVSSLGLRASRFARIGGWFYTAAELAVVLYLADEIEERVNAHLDRKAALDTLADAGEAFAAAVAAPGATADSVTEAGERYHAAWGDYRNYLYGPLHQDEALFAARLEKAARKAKLAADRREAALERIREHPSLLASVVRRSGSLEAYAESLVREDERELAADLETCSDSYRKTRDEHLREVYEENQRGRALLDGVEHLGWAFGAGADPASGTRGIFAELARRHARSRLRKALEGASRNRLEAYGDEAAVLDAALAALDASGRGELGTGLRELRSLTERTRVADDALIHGEGPGANPVRLDANGASAALEEATGSE